MKNGPYIFIVAPKEYPGKIYRGKYCYEHHLVLWKQRNILLKNNEIVHHINGDKHDNRIKNLEIMTNSQHSLKHVKRVKPIRVPCSYCKKEFYVKPNLYRYKIKKGIKMFCSSKCIGKLIGINRKAHEV